MNPINWFVSLFKSKNPTLTIEVLPPDENNNIFGLKINFDWKIPSSHHELIETADKIASLVVELNSGKLDDSLKHAISVSGYKLGDEKTCSVVFNILNKSTGGPVVPPDMVEI